ncbi:hypothetical protein CTI12_AA626400 [Artemisia annua]|uniref:Uncharacterized protein n=1 Tax=Artemisia annua TaxID=35608 RepID=A0A2U1KA96_ARTAN|nr:hypothetical protein CTI12_AA626400 [Artemisia annua]
MVGKSVTSAIGNDLGKTTYSSLSIQQHDEDDTQNQNAKNHVAVNPTNVIFGNTTNTMVHTEDTKKEERVIDEEKMLSWLENLWYFELV